MSTAQRGFASMAPEKRKAIASLGGKAAHAQGKAHRWTVEEAQAAGRKGGSARAAKRGQDTDQTAGQDTTGAGTGQDAQASGQIFNGHSSTYAKDTGFDETD